MKKIRILLPILLASTFVLTWCNSDVETEAYDSDTIISELEKSLEIAIERWNNLSAELREQDEVEVISQEELIELTAAPVNPVAPQANTNLNLNFGNQPTEAGGDYTSNTTQLNAYAHNNMVWVAVPANAKTMTINLKKDVTDNGRNIIVYVEAKGRHCGWRILWAELGEVKWSSFTFDLTNMASYPTVCGGNWSDKINGKNIAIGWYVSTYDGNGFSSITFN